MSQRSYAPNSSGKCPHCRHIVFFGAPEETKYAHVGGWFSHPTYLEIGHEGEYVLVYSSQCPNCKKPIVTAEIKVDGNISSKLVHPRGVVRTVAEEVPKHIGKDFLEAAAVLEISEKASAALSRRCLQNLLTDVGYRKTDLSKQIDLTLKDNLPKELAKNLDEVRNIGNFAAHPMKSKLTGMVIDVEPHEAEWNLDVLEGLFEHFYVRPKEEERKRKKLEAKLKEVGKPPLKQP